MSHTRCRDCKAEHVENDEARRQRRVRNEAATRVLLPCVAKMLCRSYYLAIHVPDAYQSHTTLFGQARTRVSSWKHALRIPFTADPKTEPVKDPRGYSAATLHVKWVLHSIRCLLTHTTNQVKFFDRMWCLLDCLAPS
jgi:hypothetical protein